MMLRLLCLTFLLGSISITEGKSVGAARVLCYFDSLPSEGVELCTHLVYTGSLRGEKLEALLKQIKQKTQQAKLILRIQEDDKDLKQLSKTKHIHGLEVYEAHRYLSKDLTTQKTQEARDGLSAKGGGPLLLSLPANTELMVKYYDLRALKKIADLVVVETHQLGMMENVTYHPSRLGGVWDMMNTDSMVDLVIGLGVPTSKIVVTLPSTAYKFQLINESHSTPGSPVLQTQPQVLNQEELCEEMSSEGGKWTLEREQDLSAPYAFRKTDWISFEDRYSVDVKGKYARVRGLAGVALMGIEHDKTTACGDSLLTALHKVLNSQSRLPRGAVLRSLESEILAPPSSSSSFLEAVQLSPYRITQVVDTDGVIHSLREDTRTEFTCTRQGYFVHPRSCGRFYRCVKFDQTSSDYTVFEFDCPEGLAFDSRWEVCVWPGSLSDATACPGSAEIAPVPGSRFVCPDQEGYFVDPENCRWFFACLNHGGAELTAYEFRCPFGLGFDPARLLCDWPWLVPNCGKTARYEAEAFGYTNGKLSAATGFVGQTPDEINVAAHQNLMSGATVGNTVGVLSVIPLQQEFAVTSAQPEITGSIIKDDLRQPTQSYVTPSFYTTSNTLTQQAGLINTGTGSDNSQGITLLQSDLPDHSAVKYVSSGEEGFSHSGAYTHDTSGDSYEPYRHSQSVTVPYDHKITVTSKYDDGDYSQKQSNKQKGSTYYSNNEQRQNVVQQSNYLDAQNFAGDTHTLTAGAINVGLVGQTKLVDTGYGSNEYVDGSLYDKNYNDYENGNPSVISTINTPSYSTTPSTISYTSAAPKAADIFGFSESSGKQVSQSVVEVTNYNTPKPGYDVASQLNKENLVEFSGYDYPKPKIPFEEVVQKKIAYTTQSPLSVYEQPSASYVTQEVQPSVSYVSQQTPYTTPSVIIYNKETQPTQTSYQKQETYYRYQKPEIELPEPLQPQYTASSPEPRSQEEFKPELLTQITFQKADNPIKQVQYESYQYTKPNKIFEEASYPTQAPYNTQVYQPKEFTQVFNGPVKLQEYQPQDFAQAYEVPVKQHEYQTGQYVQVNSPIQQQQYIPQQFTQIVSNPAKQIELTPKFPFTTHKPAQAEIYQNIQYTQPQYNAAAKVYSQGIFNGYDYSRPSVSFNENPFAQFVRPNEQPTPQTPPNYQKTENEQSFIQQPKTFYQQNIQYHSPSGILQEVKQQKYQISSNFKQESKFIQGGLIHRPQQIQFEYQSTQRPDQEVFIESTQQPSLHNNYQPTQLLHQTELVDSKPLLQQYSLLPQGNYNVNIPQPNQPVQKIVFNSDSPQSIVESIHFTSLPVKSTPGYIKESISNDYLPPVIQTPEYLPPVVNTEKYSPPPTKYIPSVSTVTEKYLPSLTTGKQVYIPLTVTDKYPPPTVIEKYLPPIVTEKYLPPTVTEKYLPPTVTEKYVRPTVREKYLRPIVTETYIPSALTEKYLRPTVTAKYLPPILTEKYLPPTTVEPEYSPPVTTVYIPPSTTRKYIPPSTTKQYYPTTTPRVNSVPTVTKKYLPPTKSPEYLPPRTTTFQAPEYLPPEEGDIYQDDAFQNFGLRENYKTGDKIVKISSTTSVPSLKPRKQNIAVTTYNSGSGLSYSTSPSRYEEELPVIKEYDTKKIVTTYAPIKQEQVEVTTIRPYRKKEKIAVVTKINDLNPLLIRKLGAVCSCRGQPIVVLRGTKGKSSDYSDYDYGNLFQTRGQNTETSARVTYNDYPKRSRTSTFNPIIVPDDSYYTDYDDQNNDKVSYTSSSPHYDSSTASVSVAPTARALFLKVTPSVNVRKKEEQLYLDKSKQLDRSTDNGLVRREQRLQASVECKRAGLFRHPKHCNKFYACRWDDKKERFTLHTFNCPIHLSFDFNLGACNWPSQGPACESDTMLSSVL